jgi:hypothetical protein
MIVIEEEYNSQGDKTLDGVLLSDRNENGQSILVDGLNR